MKMQKPREKLETAAKGKIKTTMIGAIESIENHLGYLWNHKSIDERTEEEEDIYQKFAIARQEILDRGHRQMKNLAREMDNYQVEEKRFKLVIPVSREDR
jgi:hypothetical protein